MVYSVITLTETMDFLHKCVPTILFALVLALIAETVQGQSRNDTLQNYLQHFNKNRHHYGNPSGKKEARDYIRDTFVKLRLHTWTEAFDTLLREVKGCNIVGMLPGQLAGTRYDRPMLIGAHYDTTRTSLGADDNGSGVVAMLEVARQLTNKSDRCTRQYSVMFVAFDFEEWENSTQKDRACAQIGCGSLAFVTNFSRFYQTFTLKQPVQNYSLLQGAIIMDTIMNYNTNPHSQQVPNVLEQSFPKQYNDIRNDSFRGNFLIAVGRHPTDDSLLNNLLHFYNLNRQGVRPSKYRALGFALEFKGRPEDLGPTNKDALSPFFRSDHISFWNTITYDKAIFLSDTANMRGYMEKCYHKTCDRLTKVLSSYLGFLAKSCDAIVMTTNKVTQAKCEPLPTESAGLAGGKIAEISAGTVSVVAGMIIGTVVFMCRRHRQPGESDQDPVVDCEQLPEDDTSDASQPEASDSDHEAQCLSVA